MNTEHTNQSSQAATAAFEQWWQRHGLEDPMDDEDRQYATASSWARRGYLAAMQAQLSRALADIAAERRRQIEAEGWTPEHDDQWQHGQLATAAGYYALASGYPHERDIGRGKVPQHWPLERIWWAPTTARRNLVKAGALISAEIERIDRASQKGGAA